MIFVRNVERSELAASSATHAMRRRRRSHALPIGAQTETARESRRGAFLSRRPPKTAARSFACQLPGRLVERAAVHGAHSPRSFACLYMAKRAPVARAAEAGAQRDGQFGNRGRPTDAPRVGSLDAYHA